MKFILTEATSRREMLQVRATLVGSAFSGAPLFPRRAARALRRKKASSDALAAMQRWFNALSFETEKLGEDLTMLSGPPKAW